MKFKIIVVFILLFTLSCSVNEDSINKQTDDYQKIASLFSTNIDAAEKLAEQSFQKYDKANEKEGIAKFAYLLGLINSVKGKYNASIDYLLISNTYSEEIGDKKFMGKGLEALIFINNELENYSISSKYLKEALALDVYDKEQRMKLLVSLARTYNGLSKRDSALKIVKKITLEAENGDRAYIASMCFHAGYLYTLLENYDLAILFSQRSIELNANKSNLAPNYNNMAFSYLMKNDTDKAMEFVNKSLNFKERFNQSHAYMTRAFINIKKKNLEQAASDLNSSVAYQPDYGKIAEGYKEIAKAYKEKGDKEQVAEFFELSTLALNDKTKLEKEKSKIAREVINKIFTYKNNVLKASLSNEAKWKNISWISGGFVIVIFIGFLYYRNRKINKLIDSIEDDYSQLMKP